jgi:hypothetical protein
VEKNKRKEKPSSHLHPKLSDRTGNTLPQKPRIVGSRLKSMRTGHKKGKMQLIAFTWRPR